ncbi:probable rRNA-processing protein EBP2 homolog [Ischnura elegans]|uniref:probable rRNA-processing protein EBP2 homolog n=1 Tax=Ischnura elegans TaxID=197161 RepID=UPI001ED87116|nr:probable rRNA-processing protein EBP2 homolog [Ischnura elegans]
MNNFGLKMEDSDWEDEGFDSDGEIQEAFSKGLLKPGLNVIEEKKECKNDVAGLKRKLAEFKLELPWIERLDLENSPAPLAPELAVELEEQKRKRENLIKKDKKNIGVEDDKALNDFRRETGFYRQAQSAVLAGIPQLQKLGVPTKRPGDYFAQMAKSDDHMQKVREVLMKKKAETERYEKIRQLRQQKTFAKKAQIENKLKKQKSKKELLEEVKKYRKGFRNDLDFLDDKKAKKPQKAEGKNKSITRAQMKKKYKDSKYGFGGKKRGKKSNTRESAADISDYKRPKKPGGKPQGRPGKSKRQKMKNRRN